MSWQNFDDLDVLNSLLEVDVFKENPSIWKGEYAGTKIGQGRELVAYLGRFTLGKTKQKCG